MKVQITVSRQACCSADDQVGPLEAHYWLVQKDSFGVLIEYIRQSNFLQFSSTHTRLTGEVNGRRVVEVYSPHSAQPRPPLFLQDADSNALVVLEDGELSFFFRHN